MPALSFLDVSHNKLTALPDTLWLAPRLRELNLSNNSLSVLPAIGSSQLRPSSSLSGSDQPGSNQSETRTYHSTMSTDDSLSINGRIDDSNITVHELKRLFEGFCFIWIVAISFIPCLLISRPRKLGGLIPEIVW